MTTAIIGTGGIGSAIARQLASGDESLRLSSADTESARKLAAEVGRAAFVAVDNGDALDGADAVVSRPSRGPGLDRWGLIAIETLAGPYRFPSERIQPAERLSQ